MSRPRILLVTTHDPRITVSGGHQRTHHIRRALSKAGDVDTLLVGRRIGMLGRDADPDPRLIGRAPDRRGRASGSLWQRAAARALPWRRRVHRRFGRDEQAEGAFRNALAGARYDVVVGRYFQSLSWTGAFESGPPLLLDVDDLPHALIAQRARVAATARRRSSLRMQERFLRRLLQRSARRCREVWVAKESDCAELGEANVRVLPNIPLVSEARELRPAAPDASTLLFVGNLGHAINVSALDAFLAGPWQEILRRVPGARLRIVGSMLEAARGEDWGRHPNVDVVGFAEDLAPHYRDCAFSVSPIWRGSGTKIKVLEALANGRTGVVTRVSHAGFETEYPDRDALLVAADPDSFARCCVELLEDRGLRDRLAARGLEAVRRHADPAKFDRVVVSAVERCTVAARGR